MNFQQFRLTYRSLIILFKIFIILVLMLWTKNTFQYFKETNFFDLISNIDALEKNSSQIWIVAKLWLINTGWFVFKVFVLKLLICLTKKFPIKSKWLVHWDNLNEISPILGREIATHLRHNKNINAVTIMDLYKYSKNQMDLLKLHWQDEYAQQIFKKYDAQFDSDLKE